MQQIIKYFRAFTLCVLLIACSAYAHGQKTPAHIRPIIPVDTSTETDVAARHPIYANPEITDRGESGTVQIKPVGKVVRHTARIPVQPVDSSMHEQDSGIRRRNENEQLNR